MAVRRGRLYESVKLIGRVAFGSRLRESELRDLRHAAAARLGGR